MRFLWLVVMVGASPSFGPEGDDSPPKGSNHADLRIACDETQDSPSASLPAEEDWQVERADLAPYFAEGKLLDARAAFSRGNYALTMALLDGQDAAPARFLRALAAHRLGDWRLSSAEFEKLAGSYGPLRDRCLVHAGWGYERLQDWVGAARVFSLVSEASRLIPDARLGLARATSALGDVPKALEVIGEYANRAAPAWGRDVGAESLLVMADLLLLKKDLKGERATLLKLWSAHPLSREAVRGASRLVVPPPLEAQIVRAEVLIEAHRNREGTILLEPLLPKMKLPDPLACRAQFALGKAYRKQRQHQKAAAMLAPLQICKDTELQAQALFALGAAQAASGQASAPSSYESMASNFPGHPLADDALFLAASSRLRRGERGQAVERLADVVDHYPQGDFAGEALFQLFWIARDEGKPEEALQYLAEIETRWEGAEESHEVERARYWRARLLEEQFKTSDALALLESISLEHPATYYGLLARERVLELDPKAGRRLGVAITAAPVTVDPFPVSAGPLGSDPQFLSAVELLRLGFGELVPAELLAIDRTALSAESLRLMVLVMSLAKEHRAAHGLARLWLRRDLSGPITAQRRAIWEIAYPNVFRDLVTRYSESAGALDPDLLQALMREESALDPKALSGAGALGLCQLMPATAAGVATRLKLQAPQPAQLLEPELNIQLGARFLADLINRLKGSKPFALASYNAGESAVARWRHELGDRDLPEWVERVPVQETRTYVKRVLRSYNSYKLLYAPGDLAKTGPTPRAPPQL